MTPERFDKIQQLLAYRQHDLTVLMDNVHKPHNLAAIARSCDAVGVLDVHAVYQRERIRLAQSSAAMGCSKWLQLHTYPDISDAYQQFREQGMQILTAHLDERAKPFREIDYTRPTAIVVGAELNGLSDQSVNAADGSIIIPMQGMTQSLNVSVATALILFEAQRQRENAGFYQQCRLPTEMHQRLLFEWTHPQVAQYCRKHKLRYPLMNEDGDIIENLDDLSPSSVDDEPCHQSNQHSIDNGEESHA